MKFLKKLWDLTGDERWTCTLIATMCIPMTLYTVLLISESPMLDAFMVALNVVMFIIAKLERDDRDD